MNMLPPSQPFASQSKNERFCRCLKCKKLFPARTDRGGRPKQFCCDKHRQAYARKVARDMKSNDVYTPAHIIELARACLGAIDLDPASCAEANEVVRAEVFYDIKQDGLRRLWSGRIWLNPPFGRYGPGFVRKAVDEFKAGKIERALVLVKATHVATRWFNDAMQVEHLICLPRKRINFSSPNYVTSSANFPSVLIGIGIARARFEDHFGHLGKIAFVSEAAP
jgi:ParB family transcriptional regulator, chromosome partitioning protein